MSRYALTMCTLALGALTLWGCLGPVDDPRPLPQPALDGSLFDARRPPVAPGYGSGYGSGAPAPSGPSGRPAMELDAGVEDVSDAADASHDALVDGSYDASDSDE